MKTIPLVILAILATPLLSMAQTPDISGAPKDIRELSAAIRDKGSAEVRAAIIRQFGPPARNIGSGVRIEQWDISGGVLTFHPHNGPTFLETKSGKSFRLMHTTNPVSANLLQGYEMTTLPDPANHGNSFWIGNLAFGADMTYRFADSGQNRGQRGAQKDNFFLLHPAGKVEVSYVAPVSAGTLLETLAEGATVARLTFTPSDGSGQATFTISSSERTRRLAFGADKPIPFAMETGWSSSWK